MLVIVFTVWGSAMTFSSRTSFLCLSSAKYYPSSRDPDAPNAPPPVRGTHRLRTLSTARWHEARRITLTLGSTVTSCRLFLRPVAGSATHRLHSVAPCSEHRGGPAIVNLPKVGAKSSATFEVARTAFVYTIRSAWPPSFPAARLSRCENASDSTLFTSH